MGSTRTGRPKSGPRLLRAVRSVGRALVRRLGLERNPLRRPSDRIEAGARVAALLVCMAAIPAAVEVGALTHAHLVATAADQAATRDRQSGTVQSDPEILAGRAAVVATARVVWTSATGSTHEATIGVPAGSHRGDRITVWTTRGDVPTASPLSVRDAVALAGLAAVGLLLAVAGSTLLLLNALRWALDRGRYRAWATGWTQLDAARRR